MRKSIFFLPCLLSWFVCGNNGPIIQDKELQISNVTASEITSESAKITWKSNVKSSSQIFYGTDQALARSTSENTSLVTDHQVVLSGLSPNTFYYFKVASRDETNQLKESPTLQSFKTDTISTTGPLIRNVQILSVTSSSAIIAWETDMAADGKIEYGKTTSYGQMVQDQDNFILIHSLSLPNLDPNQRYQFRVCSKSRWGYSSTSENYYFDTKDLGKLSLFPGSINAKVGDTIRLEVALENVVDLFALRFSLTMNTGYLDYVDKKDSTLINDSRYGKINFLKDPAYSNDPLGFVATWTIRYNGDQPIGTEVDLENKRAVVCVLLFRALSEGETRFDFSEYELLDAAQNTIKIYQPAPVPVYIRN